MDTQNNEQASDESLAQQVQNGDLAAFDVLLARYYPKIQRYGRKFLLGSQDIEDTTQEIFLKAYRFIKSFSPERRFSPWVYAIAHNEFINLGKKRQKEPIEYFDFDSFFPHPAKDDGTEQELDRQQLKAQMEACLEQLPAKYREVVVLYYFEELDYKDIAEVLKVPVATVGIRLSRAKKRLVALTLKLKPSLSA